MDVCGLRCHVYHKGPWNVWRTVHSRPNLTWLITELRVVASEVTPAQSAPRHSCKCRSEMRAKSLSNLALIYCWPQPTSLCLSKENLIQGVRKFAKSSSVLSHFILTTTLGSVGFITPFYVNLTKVIKDEVWIQIQGYVWTHIPSPLPQPPALPLMSEKTDVGKDGEAKSTIARREISPSQAWGSVSEQLTLGSGAVGSPAWPAICNPHLTLEVGGWVDAYIQVFMSNTSSGLYSEILITVLCNQPELNQMLRYLLLWHILLMNSTSKPQANCCFRGQRPYKLKPHTLFQRQLFPVSFQEKLPLKRGGVGGIQLAQKLLRKKNT